MSNEILKNDNAITLDWGDVTSATKYWLQVSKGYLDFRATLLHEDNNLATSTDTVTATGNGRYFYRWRPFVVSWQPWREVSSFIVNTSASTDVSATSWMFINKADVTDTYILENQPITLPRMEPAHLFEAFRRNRAGKLRSQQYKTKYNITIDISRYLGNNQKAEIMRFYNMHVPFYLATRYEHQIATETNYVYRCFEVMFTPPAPQLDIVGGNILEFTEV